MVWLGTMRSGQAWHGKVLFHSPSFLGGWDQHGPCLGRVRLGMARRCKVWLGGLRWCLEGSGGVWQGIIVHAPSILGGWTREGRTMVGRRSGLEWHGVTRSGVAGHRRGGVRSGKVRKGGLR